MGKEKEEFVRNLHELGNKFADAAAGYAGESFERRSGATSEQRRALEMVYAKAMFDAYMTGAIEGMRLLRGVKESVPWKEHEDYDSEILKELEGHLF